MTAELDGRLMRDRASAHDHLQAQLGLPDYYGRNLDALYDVLTERAEQWEVTVLYIDILHEQLGRYAEALLKTLLEAAAENPALMVRIE